MFFKNLQIISQIFKNSSIFYKPIRSKDTLKMTPMITAGLTKCGVNPTTGKRITSPMFSMGRGQRPRKDGVLALQP